MGFALIACRSSSTNTALIAASPREAPWVERTPQQALGEFGFGDAVLGRLDVLPSLDGVDDGLWALGALAARGVTVLNEPAALLAAHDKLLTARLLRRHGIAHPRTWHVRQGRPRPRLSGAVVLKPRFGSWGREVRRCDDPVELDAVLEEIRDAPWYRLHGALVQELVPPAGYDLRILIAAGRVAGAAFRSAAPGEWRTNVTLGGVRTSVTDVPADAARIALAAARAIGALLVGVDLLPAPSGWVVAELNGAVEFTDDYGRGMGEDVFVACARMLTNEAARRRSPLDEDLALGMRIG
jgi:gamma-F420-2:alpha-L-glutamate ligase